MSSARVFLGGGGGSCSNSSLTPVKQNNFFSDTQYNIQILDIFCIHSAALHKLATFQNTLCTVTATALPPSPTLPADSTGSWLIQHVLSSA
jgi:hypothetical protein